MCPKPLFTGSRILATLLCGLAVALSGCAKKNARASAPARPPQAARIGSTEEGVASWYGEPYHGRRAASGEVYDMNQLTAAHRSLPFQTWVEVTNLRNNKHVDVRITDRGPFVDGRIVDLSLAAAREIDMVRDGVVPVRLRVIEAPKEAQNQNGVIVYAVQAGAFSDSSRAAALRDSLPFPEARVASRDSRLWRVLVGRGLNMDAATRLAKSVEDITGEALVVRDE